MPNRLTNRSALTSSKKPTKSPLRSDPGDRDELVDELGDVLLQPVFHAEIASETGAFTFDDIAKAICEKLIRRHPHVFADSTIEDHPDAVVSQWEQIKESEKSVGSESASRDSILKNANDGLPALMAAQKIQKKVAKVGFDWPEIEPVLEKVREEVAEVEEALSENEGVAEEIGDLLFAVVNLARKSGHQAEELLDAANRKFVARFQETEKASPSKPSKRKASPSKKLRSKKWTPPGTRRN